MLKLKKNKFLFYLKLNLKNIINQNFPISKAIVKETKANIEFGNGRSWELYRIGNSVPNR